MSEPADSLAGIPGLIDALRVREAFVLFLECVDGRAWPDLSDAQLRALDTVCSRVLPELLEHHVLWMVSRPGQLRQMLVLLGDSLRANYRAPATLDQIAWIRCLLAISEARAGRPARVHEELCLSCGRPWPESIPPPNGTFREQTKELELNEGAATAFLRPFFAAYLDFLRRQGQHELANHIESRIGRLLGLLARDETCPGIVQALFHVRGEGGRSRFVHVSLEYRPASEGKPGPWEGIVYARQIIDHLDTSMQEAAKWAREAADAYLRQNGYPDGLDERLVHWEITTLWGDTADLPRQYAGASISLPLAVAIVSEYLDRLVPNDVALTGAFGAVSASSGSILPVDGVPEKVEHAIRGGCRLIFTPAGNSLELDERPALRHLAAEHDACIVSVVTLDEVCKRLFPPEGSGRLWDMLRDTATNLLEITGFRKPRERPFAGQATHQRHRLHVRMCGLLVAALVLCEGLIVCKGLAPTCPAGRALSLILPSAAIVGLGMWASFSLADAGLSHRKSWPWFVSIALTAMCFGTALLLFSRILPSEADLSRRYAFVPVAGVMKDLFLMWFFAWGVATNTYNAVAAFERLVDRHQFVTARQCLRWDSPLEGRLPLRCVHFPWSWGALGIAVISVILVYFDMDFLGSLRTETDAGYWYFLMALGRDILFVVAIAEVMLFYKTALADVRKAFS
jgi:hypothetical protein